MASYEPGQYEGQVVAQGFSESKEKKTPYFFLRFKVLSRFANGERYEDQDNYEREVRLWLTEKTVERARDAIVDLGWSGESWGDLEPGGSCDLTSKVIELTCTHEIVSDKTYERWELSGQRGPEATEHVSGMARKLDTLFQAALKKRKAGGKPSKPKPPQREIEKLHSALAEAAEGADDVPF